MRDKRGKRGHKGKRDKKGKRGKRGKTEMLPCLERQMKIENVKIIPVSIICFAF